jgi:serine protease Do
VKLRDFLSMAAGAVAWPFAAYAQPPTVSPPCGSIGVRVHPMTAAFAASLGMAEPYGAIFGKPQSGSPAAKAGIERYDVVTAIEGLPVRSWRDFAPTIAKIAPGTLVHLTTWRSQQLNDVRVVVGSAPCGVGAANAR